MSNDLIDQLIWNFTDIKGEAWFHEISIVIVDFLNYTNLDVESRKSTN